MSSNSRDRRFLTARGLPFVASGEYQTFRYSTNDVPTSIGTTNWQDINNALILDGQDASLLWNNMPAVVVSKYLSVTSLLLSIPSDAVISGISVNIRRQAAVGDIQDESIILIKNGVQIVGSDDKASATAWSSTEIDVVYGGAADTWTAALTPADIEDNSFGVAIAVNNTGSDGIGFDIPSIDYISIAIHYA